MIFSDCFLPIVRDILREFVEGTDLPLPATVISACCGLAAVRGEDSPPVATPLGSFGQFGTSHPLLAHCVGCGAVYDDNRKYADAPAGVDHTMLLPNGHPGSVDRTSWDVDPLDTLVAATEVTKVGLEYAERWRKATSGMQVLVPGDEVTEIVVDLIDSAKHTIRMCSYSARMDSRVAAALGRAVKRGVSLWGVYDRPQLLSERRSEAKRAAAEGRKPRRIGMPLAEHAWRSNVDVRISLGRDLFEPNSRTTEHGKLLIVDGRCAVYGSMNLSYSGLQRAATGEIPVLTVDPRRVQELNNTVFVDRWFRRQPTKEEGKEIFRVFQNSTEARRPVQTPIGVRDEVGYQRLAFAAAVFHVRSTLALGLVEPEVPWAAGPWDSRMASELNVQD